MSLQNPRSPIELRPGNRPTSKRVLTRANPLILLYWLWRDPYALQDYLEQNTSLLSNPNELSVSAQYKQDGFNLFLQIIEVALIPILIVELAFVLCTNDVLPTRDLLEVILISLGWGFFIGVILFLMLGFWLGDFVTAATWGFWLLLGLPLLYTLEIWAFHSFPNSKNSIWFVFNGLAGFYWGMLLNGLGYGLKRLNTPYTERLTVYIIMVFMGLPLVSFCWYTYKFSGILTVAQIIGGIMIGVLATGIGIMRIDDFIYGYVQTYYPPDQNGYWLVPRITLISPPKVFKYLQHRFKMDWNDGLHNADQIWRYTNLDGTVILLIRKQFNYTQRLEDKDIIELTSDLSNDRFTWQLTEFFPELSNTLFSWLHIQDTFDGLRHVRVEQAYTTHHNARTISYESTSTKVQNPDKKVNQGTFDSTLLAMITGFLYLNKEQPRQALIAFEQAGKQKHLSELKELISAVTTIWERSDLGRNDPHLDIVIPTQSSWHETSWIAIRQLKEAFHYIWLYRRCAGKDAQQMTQAYATDLLDKVERAALLWPEGSLLQAVAKKWKMLTPGIVIGSSLLTLQPIENPYTLKPRSNSLYFIKRTAELDAIQEGLSPNTRRPILLYGHSRVGKTFILSHLASLFTIFRFNLAHLSDSVEPEIQILGQLCQAIANFIKLEPPTNEQLQRNPYNIFDSFITQVPRHLADTTIVIVLDGIEALRSARKRSNQLLNVLRHFHHHIKIDSSVNFIFSGQLTPDEFDLYMPEFSMDLLRIPITCFDYESTEQLLQNPTPQFIPRYHYKAIELIHNTYTNGQPYLVQAFGRYLVHYFNQDIKQGKHRDPLFTEVDIKAVTASKLFRDAFRSYFTEILSIARYINPNSKLVLTCLAERKNGLREGYLHMRMVKFGITSDQLSSILRSLESVDIIRAEDANKETRRWYITVGLVRMHLNPQNSTID